MFSPEPFLQERSGNKIEDVALFSSNQVIATAGVYNAGCPRLPTRLCSFIGLNEQKIGLICYWFEHGRRKAKATP